MIKTFNLARIQATNVVIQDAGLRKTFNDFVGGIMPNPFTVAATIGAYNEGDEWLEQLRDYPARRALIVETFERIAKQFGLTLELKGG